jgi:hypothetical protein
MTFRVVKNQERITKFRSIRNSLEIALIFLFFFTLVEGIMHIGVTLRQGVSFLGKILKIKVLRQFRVKFASYKKFCDIIKIIVTDIDRAIEEAEELLFQAKTAEIKDVLRKSYYELLKKNTVTLMIREIYHCKSYLKWRKK